MGSHKTAHDYPTDFPSIPKENIMSDPVYKMIELTGTSPTSVEEAVNNAITRSSETIRQIGWFEVVEIRGRVNEGAVDQWQVTVKVGFKLEG